MAEGPGTPFGESVGAALFARRILVVQGEIDDGRASELSASLMTLDALGDDRIEVRLSSAASSLEVGLMLVDVLEVVGVPVHTVGLGRLSGGVVGVLAAGSRRLLGRHVRLELREPDVAVDGRASEIERRLAEALSRRELFQRHLAMSTGRPFAEIEAEWSRGASLDAADAVSLGYADAVEAGVSPS